MPAVKDLLPYQSWLKLSKTYRVLEREMLSIQIKLVLALGATKHSLIQPYAIAPGTSVVTFSPIAALGL